MAQSKTQRKQDSLKRLLKTQLPDKQRVDAMLALINTYIIKSPEKGYQPLKETLKLAQKINYDNGIAQCYDRWGLYYKHAGQFDLSIQYYLKGLRIHEKLKNERKIAASLGNIGIVYKRLDDFKTAFDYQFKALKLMKKLKANGMIANTYNNIGLIYLMTEDYPKALEYFDKTLEMDKKDNFELGIGSDYSNIAMANYKMGKYEEALQIEMKALKIRQKIKHNNGLMISYKNLGYIYDYLKQYDQSLKYFRKSKDMGLKLKAQEDIAEGYKGMSMAYEKLGRYKLALEYHQKFKSKQDSVFNLGKNKQITQMKTRYETEKKEQENQVLRHQTEVQQSEIARQQLYNTLIAIALLITLGFIYLGYRLFQEKKKNVQQLQQLNNEIKEQNQALQHKQKEILEQREEIALQAEELTVTNEQLVQLDKFKQSMTSMIVHDLKNPLNTIIGLSADQYNPDFQKSIHQSGRNMFNLVMNILDVQRFEETEIQLNLKPHSLRQITNNAHEAVYQALTEKNITFETNINEGHLLQIDGALIERVFINLLSNAIKYTPAQGQIKVMIENMPHSTFCKILFQDSGVGIPEEFLASIFDKYAQHNPRARSTGLGLTFCKLVTEAHDGTIGVTSELRQGSTFWLTLPKSTETHQQITLAKDGNQSSNQLMIELSEADRALLLPIVAELQQYEIYEASAIKRTLNSLDQTNPRLNKWRTAVEKTLYASNEAHYQQLIRLVENPDS